MNRRLLLAASVLSLALPVALSGPVFADPPPQAADQPIDLQNAKCPVKGVPVKPGVTETVNGMIVHFCCMNCAAKYKANPSAYEAALKADPEVARRMALAHPDEAAAPAAPTGLVTPGGLSESALKLHDGMRKLWADHVSWTRLFIVSALGGLPDKDATLQRLLKNQQEIGDALKPLYGDDAGTKLTALLRDHISIAGELVGAAAAGDSAKTDDATKRWNANADDLAKFLSKANPQAWPFDAARKMLGDHLALTTEEVKARIAKDWDADIAAYEKIRLQAIEMADMLSDGVRKQFPDKFR